jgi:signal transduction histidine kinase
VLTAKGTLPATILLVEDNKDLRENAVLVLQLEGYTVQAAADGREALEILNSGLVPNVIVSDIMMPHMDGYEFFDAVRKRHHLRTVPFIFLTARSSRQDMATGRLLGADDYLVKPFDPDELLVAIQTRLRRNAEIRAEAREDLQDARRQLVELLSHELRTPLTYVTGGFALLAEELKHRSHNPASEDIEASLQLIQSGTQRLNRLAEQMVLYSQIISSHVARRLESSAEDLDLAFLVYDALDSVSHLANERGITIRREVFDAERLTVDGLHDLLVIALGEVIRNAILYSPEGASIKITLIREGKWGAFTVVDQGRGIPPEDQANIWNIMIQSERDHDEQQGAGMGLPLVKGIITEHSGEVYLDSVPGQGTRVTLRLPLVFN